MRQRAFTLLELIIVLAIIAILSVMVSMKVTGLVQDEREVRIDADLALLCTACEAFSQDYPKAQADCQEDLIAKHLLQRRIESPIDGYDYALCVSEEKSRVALEKEGQVYTHGDFIAERYTDRVFPH